MMGRLDRWFAGALVALWNVSAQAGDTSDIQSLLSETVITTASSTAQRASAAPATSTTVTAEDLRTYGVRTLAEAINFLSLAVVTADPLRTPDIGSRGVLLTNDNGKHFLLLVNGHAMNDPLYGAARFDQGAGIPFELIDHLEVVVGPGSVLYGSNAMMGVINVITKSAHDYNGVHVSGDFEPGRSFRASAGTGFTFKLGGTPGEVSAAVDYYQRFGPTLEFSPVVVPTIVTSTGGLGTRFHRNNPERNVWGGQSADGYFAQVPSGMLRLRWGDFDVNLFASAYRRGLAFSSAADEVLVDDPDSYERDRSLRLDVKHHAMLSSLVELTSRLYGDTFGYQRYINGSAFAACTRQDIETCTYHDVGMAHWVGLEERLSLDWLHDLSLVSMLGMDVRQQWAKSKQDLLNFETGLPLAATAGRLDVRGSIVSPYLQQTYNPTAWLDLNVGARLDVDSRYSPVLSPRGALAVRPASGMTVKAIYSEAFRAPTWSETDLSNYRIAPSNNLRPETVRSLEGSIEQAFGTHRLLFGVFRSWWSDLAASEPVSSEERNRLQAEGRLPAYITDGLLQAHNVANMDNYGWNGSYQGTLGQGRLRYGVNATGAYTRREVGSSSAPLAAAPQLFGNVRVAYNPGGYLPTPALTVSYVGARLEDRERMYLASARYARPVAEVRLTFSGAIPGIRGLSYRASGAYATAAEGAYIAGPANVTASFLAQNATTPGALAPAPIDRFRVFFGLQYDLFQGSQTGEFR